MPIWSIRWPSSGAPMPRSNLPAPICRPMRGPRPRGRTSMACRREIQPAPWPGGRSDALGFAAQRDRRPIRPRFSKPPRATSCKRFPPRRWPSTAASPSRASRIAIVWRSRRVDNCGSTCWLVGPARALDGVLSIQNEQGGELAGERRSARHERSGPRFQGARRHERRRRRRCAICRVAAGRILSIAFPCRPPVGPITRFRLSDERYLVPKDGAALVRVRVDRAGYNGPIKLDFPNLPASVSITGDEIPAGAATEALVTLTAPGLSPAQALTTVLGTSTEPNTAIKRPALVPAKRRQQAPAVAARRSGRGRHDAQPAGARLGLVRRPMRSLRVGTALPVKLRVQRAAGAAGAVRLTLLTTQITPRKTRQGTTISRPRGGRRRAARFASRRRRRLPPIRTKRRPRSSCPAICRRSPTTWRSKPICWRPTTKQCWPLP